MPVPFVSFPDIEGFHSVIRAVEVYPYIAESPVHYRAKTKLHGTNAGVRMKGGEVAAQSRTRIVTVEDDNNGFARWLKGREEIFRRVPLDDITVFGEWCGPGIMKNSVANQLPHKVFAVFAIVLGNSETGTMIVCPGKIQELLGNNLPDDIQVLPWYGDTLLADFNDRASLQAVADAGNKVVQEVEPCDPWAKYVFGVEGIGEGVVYYPSRGETIPRKRFSDLAFKAKGKKHKVVRTKEAVQIDPEVAKSTEEFVTLFVTEPRLEQGVAATGGVADVKAMGPFLKWFVGDVQKESKAELEASGLAWEQVSKPVMNAARNWYMAKSVTI